MAYKSIEHVWYLHTKLKQNGFVCHCRCDAMQCMLNTMEVEVSSDGGWTMATANKRGSIRVNERGKTITANNDFTIRVNLWRFNIHICNFPIKRTNTTFLECTMFHFWFGFRVEHRFSVVFFFWFCYSHEGCAASLSKPYVSKINNNNTHIAADVALSSGGSCGVHTHTQNKIVKLDCFTRACTRPTFPNRSLVAAQ